LHRRFFFCVTTLPLGCNLNPLPMYLLLLISHLLPIFRPSPYHQAFGETYNQAIQTLHSAQSMFGETAPNCNCDAKIISAIIFPELLRYNDLSNLIETSALELLYAEGGINAMDFSIGAAQIKPSFAERMEQVSKNPKLIPLFDDNNIASRRARLQRLEDLQWQYRYVCAFTHYLAQRFPELSNLPPKEKIMFLASAYNYGADASKQEIEHWQHVKAFPYGQKYLGNQYSYAAIAADYYLRNLNPLP